MSVGRRRFYPGLPAQLSAVPALATGGDGVIEIFTKRLCSGCVEVKRVLDAAGVSYREWDCDTVDGLAEWAFRGAPETLPAVWAGGAWVDPGQTDPRHLAEAAIAAERDAAPNTKGTTDAM